MRRSWWMHALAVQVRKRDPTPSLCTRSSQSCAAFARRLLTFETFQAQPGFDRASLTEELELQSVSIVSNGSKITEDWIRKNGAAKGDGMVFLQQRSVSSCRVMFGRLCLIGVGGRGTYVDILAISCDSFQEDDLFTLFFCQARSQAPEFKLQHVDWESFRRGIVRIIWMLPTQSHNWGGFTITGVRFWGPCYQGILLGAPLRCCLCTSRNTSPDTSTLDELFGISPPGLFPTGCLNSISLWTFNS